MRKLFYLFFALCLTLTGCGKEEKPIQNGKLPVVASFYAMKELTEAVGGNKVHVTTLVPEGSEPHDFQPTPRQLKQLHSAKVFITQGLGMEPWGEEMVKAADNPKLQVVTAAKHVDAIENEDEEEIEEHGKYDPHAWLSLLSAKAEAETIAEALAQADPANGAYYKANARALGQQLDGLYVEYREKFQQVPRKEFVTGHEAFGYLCREFGLNQQSLESMFAGGEPNAKEMARLVRYARDHHVTTIFREANVSPKSSEALAREIGARVVPIHTMESHEGQGGYAAQMRENLERIYESLK